MDGNPCGKCAACRGIDDGSILDVIEIDAASNNGVDNIRDLREEANYTPSAVKYRVYIIDEVHMLSVGAFNALLKTLEEPPEHVKFILATTEVHKLPSTILSRCQRFDFKRISPEDIAKRLSFVADKENIDLTPEAAMLISRIADGALRDALSLLDRCASYGTEITEKVASDAAGIAGREHLFELVDAVISHDSPRALTIIDELYNNSCDMERLLSELLSHFRNMMVALTVPNFRELVICPDSEIEIIRRQAKSLTLESVLSCMDRIGDAIVEIKRGADRRTSAEMAVIRLTSPKLDTDTAAVLRRISDIEKKLKNGVFKPSPESLESDFAANTSPVKQSEPNEAQTQQVKNEKPESKEAVSDKTPAAYDEPNNAAAAQVGLKDYDALLDSAASETTDLNARYDRYAQAQAWLEDSSLVIPLTVGNGAAPVISRLTPFTGASMQVGDKTSSDYFKYVKPQEKVVTKKEYEQSREKWLKEKKASNEKAQKDLEKHVK